VLPRRALVSADGGTTWSGPTQVGAGLGYVYDAELSPDGAFVDTVHDAVEMTFQRVPAGGRVVPLGRPERRRLRADGYVARVGRRPCHAAGQLPGAHLALGPPRVRAAADDRRARARRPADPRRGVVDACGSRHVAGAIVRYRSGRGVRIGRTFVMC
jgi:hypothetical protein